MWAKSNNRTRGQFECNMACFFFCFDFVCSHAGAVVVPYFVGKGGVLVEKLNIQDQGGRNILDVDGQGSGGS